MRQQLKLWDSKRERINLGKALNLGTTHPFPEQRTEQNTREEPAAVDRPIPRRRQETGGRGKGQTQPQRWHPYQRANRLPASNQRLPEILDGRHPPGGSQLESSSPEQTQETGWDRGGEKVHCTRGECSWMPELLGQGRLRTQAQPSLRLCVVLENLNLSRTPESEQLRSGKCMQPRARSLESSLEPEQCRRGKHTP